MPLWTSPSREHELSPRILVYFVVAVTLSSIALHFAFIGWKPAGLFRGATIGASASLVLYLFWNHVAWKWGPLGAGRPKVWGTWKGTLHGHYRNDDQAGAQEIELPVYAVVRQSATSASYEQLQAESRSHTLYSRLTQRDGKWMLLGAYQNHPEGVSLNQHRGSFELILTSDEIEGVYWNERWSKGTLRFRERRPEFAATLGAAKRLFGDEEE